MVIDKIITDEKLQVTYTYIDNIKVYSHDKTNRDRSLKRFMVAVGKCNLTLSNVIWVKRH